MRYAVIVSPALAHRILGASVGFCCTLMLARSSAAADNAAPLQVEVSDTTSVVYNHDNRNTRPAVVGTVLDDHWAGWYNRLEVRARSNPWQLGLRVDNAWFLGAPTPTEAGLDLLQIRRGSAAEPISGADAEFFLGKTLEADRELANRYVNWLYPAKYHATYNTPKLELAVGDLYAQFGRGLVLSVRRVDELSSDTTLRGARISTRVPIDGATVRMTAVGGSMNPLRLEETTGRYLSVDGSVTPGFLALTEGGMPTPIKTVGIPQPTPAYAPDRLGGAQVEATWEGLQLAAQGSLLIRQRPLTLDLLRTADSTRTYSLSANLPALFNGASLYMEGAGQQLRHSGASALDLDGHALYANLTILVTPVSVTFEGRNFRRFFPLVANVDLKQAPEWGVARYSAPPAAEELGADTEFGGFNTCVTGGRIKGDVQVGGRESVFFWLGRHNTWAESVANEACTQSSANLNRIWDVASGFELRMRRRRSHIRTTIGGRLDQTERELATLSGDATQIFYQESYFKYETDWWLTGLWTIQLQGKHRRRNLPLVANDAYFESTNLVGVQRGKLTLATGFEYDTNPLSPDTFINAQLRHRFSLDSTVSLFVGQRRGGLQCVAGVCRLVAPFEGVRLDLAMRL